MPRDKAILVCTECFSRNYTITKKKNDVTKRLVLNKYCPRCNKHTEHRESK